MGDNVVSLLVSGPGDRAALHAAIWESSHAFIEQYLGSAANRAARDYLDDAVSAAEARGEWRVQDDELVWTFPDFGGECRRSATAWEHWLSLAIRADWDRVAQLAGEHDLGITLPLFSLAEMLAGEHHGSPFVTLRDDLWIVAADILVLFGDGDMLDAEELGGAERAQFELAGRRCQCGPCVMLRPEPEILQAMLGGLRRPETASSAAWYLARMSEATPEILTTLVRAGDVNLDGLVTAIERYAARLPGTEGLLVGLLPDLNGGALGAALYGLASIRTSSATQATMLEQARAVLADTGSGAPTHAAGAGSDGAAVAAAEIVGQIGRDDPYIREELGAVLAREGISDKLRHNVVLGLVNLHLPPSPPPSVGVELLLRRESTEDSDAGRLARWLLDSVLRDR